MKKSIFAVLAAVLLFSACPPTPPLTEVPGFDYDIAVSTEPRVGSVNISLTGSTSAQGVELLLLAYDQMDDYLFDHWEGDVTGTANPVSLTAQKDVSVKAVYVRAYTLTLAGEPSGLNISGFTFTPPGVIKSSAKRVFKTGTTVSIGASALSNGYIFREWNGAVTGKTEHTSLVMDADKQLTTVYLESGTNALFTVGDIAQDVLTNKGNPVDTIDDPLTYLHTVNGAGGGYCNYALKVEFGETGITYTHTWEFFDYQDAAGNIVDNAGAAPFILTEAGGTSGTSGTFSGDINLTHHCGYNMAMTYDYAYSEKSAAESILEGEGLSSGTCTISCQDHYTDKVYDHTYLLYLK